MVILIIMLLITLCHNRYCNIIAAAGALISMCLGSTPSRRWMACARLGPVGLVLCVSILTNTIMIIIIISCSIIIIIIIIIIISSSSSSSSMCSIITIRTIISCFIISCIIMFIIICISIIIIIIIIIMTIIIFIIIIISSSSSMYVSLDLLGMASMLGCREARVRIERRRKCRKRL